MPAHLAECLTGLAALRGGGFVLGGAGACDTLLGQITGPSSDHVMRLVAAVALGGIVGLERELRDKPAGFRTIVLISVGACIFTILSQVVGGPDWNSTRIAAQIVSGIGFLGAGAILRDRTNVIGLTTAATIWAVAAIGMAAGFGHFALATEGTVAILVALFIFDYVETWVGTRRDLQAYHITIDKRGNALERIKALFEQANLKVRKRTLHEEGTGIVVHVWAMGRKADHETLRIKLAQSDEYRLGRS